MRNKLFVGGLAWGTDEHSLRDAFSRFGDVTEAKVIYDRYSGRSRGFGFVTMESGYEAAEAMATMNGAVLDGRTIRVNEAHERRSGRESANRYRSDARSNRPYRPDVSRDRRSGGYAERTDRW